MMIRVNGEYLDFNDDIEVESQIKLFEEIDSSKGDWSYKSEMEDSNHNRKILGIPLPDTIKIIYRNVLCDLIDESGFVVYSGRLRVENIADGKIGFSFFSGNNNWLGLLSEPISSLPLHKYNVDITEANIQASWSSDSGIVFPILDTGALITRSFSNLKIEDFVACFYVKTLFKEIFNAQGIKIRGDLLKDDIYNMAVVASNGRSQEEVRNRSCYVNKTTGQNIGGVSTKITFQDETTYPFFDGSQNNFVSSTYTADVKMRVDTSLNLSVDGSGGTSVFTLRYLVNGAIIKSASYSVDDTGGNLSRSLQVSLEAGDYLEIFIVVTAFQNLNVTAGSIKITPVYVYKVFGGSSVPNWTQIELVSNIFRLLNVLPSYNSESKTLTLNLFNKIKEKLPIDVSDEITIVDTDFVEFVSDYGKKNYFKYQQSDNEDLRQYNVSNFIKYGEGSLDVDNDFIEQTADVVESDFTAPITYLNGIFDMSMERFNFVELKDILDRPITSIDDDSGRASIKVSSANSYFAVGDLIRIEASIEAYNGEWVIDAVASGSITVNGLFYDSGAATGTATLVRHQFTTDDSVYLFVNAPEMKTREFSSMNQMLIDNSSFSTTAIAYFNLLSNGTVINTKYKQSLSFGSINNPLSYQKTLLDTYWPIFKSILNDPVMLRVLGSFDRNKFTAIKTFLNPLRVKTNETNNLYYLNRTTGYKSKDQPCECELIKL